jgi:hypothetical protein
VRPATVSPPKRRGFGTVVMQEMVEHSVDGDVALDYTPSGLTWRLTAQLRARWSSDRPRNARACGQWPVLDIHAVPFTADQQVLMDTHQHVGVQGNLQTIFAGLQSLLVPPASSPPLAPWQPQRARKRAGRPQTITAKIVPSCGRRHFIDDSPSDHPATPLGLAYATAAACQL